LPAKTVMYRDYEFEVYASVGGADQWRAVIWPPNNAPPIVTPGHVSGAEAIAAALVTIDRALDGHPAA
jgi:hypothetical protein